MQYGSIPAYLGLIGSPPPHRPRLFSDVEVPEADFLHVSSMGPGTS